MICKNIYYLEAEKSIRQALNDVIETHLPDEMERLRLSIPTIQWCRKTENAAGLVNIWAWIIDRPDYMAVVSPKPIITRHDLYELWIDSNKKEFPCFQDYYEHVTGEKLRHY